MYFNTKKIISVFLMVVILLSFANVPIFAEDTKQDHILGDIDGDGDVDHIDQIILTEIVYHGRKVDLKLKNRSDINNDNKLTISDINSLIKVMNSSNIASHELIESGSINKNISWSLFDDGLLIIEGEGSIPSYTRIVTSSSEGSPFWNDKRIKKVVCGSGITSIGSYVFQWCHNIDEIFFPGTVERISDYAFERKYDSYNYEMRRVTSPIQVPRLNPSEMYIIPLKNNFRISANSSIKNLKIFPGADNFVIDELESITSIDVPDGIQSFNIKNCSSLQTIKLPNSIIELEESSLIRCSSLNNITIPDSVLSIERAPLSGCWGLKELSIPFVGKSRSAGGDVDGVFGHLFGQATNGEYFVANQYYSVHNFVEYHIPTSLKKVYITDATQIPFGAFAGCIGIDYIELNEGVTSISQNAFANCDFLSVKIPKSVEYIGTDAFAGTDILKLFVYEDSYAHKYAKENNYPYELIGSSSSNKQNYETENENKEEIEEIIRDISVNGVTLDYDELEMNVGETAKLGIDISPNYATNKDVIWSTSKSSVATVKNGKVVAVGVGTAKITVETEDGGYKATCIVTVEDVEENKNNQMVLKIGSKRAMVFGKSKSNDVAPKIVNGRTMLPARFVTENLGATVEWNADAPDMVLITKDNITIIIYIGANYAYVNGKKEVLDSPAFIENGRTYTPVRFICESLGADVDWKQETQEVIIIKK